MSKFYLGIDIGINGCLTIINNQNSIIISEPTPTIDVLINKKIRKHYDIQSINELFKGWISDYTIVKAGFERMKPIPAQASQVAFSLGGGAMLFKVMCTVYKIPYIEIEPRSWQKEIFKRAGIQYDGNTTKIASIAAAKRLFPGFCFKRTAKCKVDDANMTDSACIAMYVKLIN